MNTAVKGLIATAITLALAACGGGGNNAATPPAPVPDTTPPTVVSVTPANGITGVSSSTTVSVNFSELINCATATGSSVTLTSNGNAIAGAVTCSGSSATVTPSAALALNGTYTLNVGTAVKDVAGNALSSAFSSTFLTAVTASPNQYTVSGTLAGLNSGRGLALVLNGGPPASQTSNGSFAFGTLLNDGAAYNVSIASQPFDQQCVLANATGLISAANVTNMTVTCSNVVVPLTIANVTPVNNATGITGTTTVSANFSDVLDCASVNTGSVTLAPVSTPTNTVAGSVACSGNSATFIPTASLSLNTAYAFNIGTLVKSASGSALASAFSSTFTTANAVVTNQYRVDGTLAGLNSGRGLALVLNGGPPTSLTSNGPFSLGGLLNDGAAYNVSIASQPFDQQCVLANATGVISAANVTNMTVMCSNVVAPLSVVNVTPANNATDITGNTTISANFSDVLDCASVNSGSVTLALAATPATTIAGSVACSGNSATFIPAASLPLNTTYTFNVGTLVKSASGSALASAFSSTFTTANAVVNNQYTVGGNLTGLANGRGVALQVNGTNTLSLTSSGTFVFATNLGTGAAYNVSVLTQPDQQSCIVTNGSGLLAASNITDIAVSCTTNTYTVNGVLNGLGAGKTVTLQNNGTDNVTFTGDGSLTFRTPLPALSAYNVTVSAQPVGQTCTVSNGNGILGTVNVVNIAIQCVNNSYTVGGTLSGLGNGNSLTLQNNGANALVINNSGSFSFANSIVTGGGYNVTVATQPSLQVCSVSNGSGNVVGANITDVTVSCSAVTLPSASTLSAAYGLKQLQFSWSPAGNATYYKLMSTVDGIAPFTQVGSDITATNVNVDIAVHLTDWVNARYRVDACNPGGCTSSTSIEVIGGVISTIGYVKASNTGSSDLYGFAVAVSGDGNTLAVGAPKEDSVSVGINGDETDNTSADQGAVYIYARQNGIWVKQAYLKSPKAQAGEYFGYSLALSRDGNVLAVGAPRENSLAMGVNNFIDQAAGASVGAVFTFVRSAGVWSNQAFIKDTLPDGLTRSQNFGNGQLLYFGTSVGLSADGHTLVVGAPFTTTVDAGVRLGAQPSGGTALLSAANSNSGSAFVFSNELGAWTQEAIFKANNNASLQPMFFGVSVAISGNGDTIAVAAQNEQSAGTGVNGSQATGTHPGAAYVFQRTRLNSVVNWTQEAYFKGDADNSNLLVYGSTLPTNLFSSNRTVALSHDGNTLVAVPYVFGRDPVSGVWTKQSVLPKPTGVTFNIGGIGVGNTVAMNTEGTLIAVGGFADFSSSTTHNLYARSSTTSTTWTPMNNLSSVESELQANHDSFGVGIAMSEDGKTLAIGAPTEDSNATLIGGDHTNNSSAASGAVYLY